MDLLEEIIVSTFLGKVVFANHSSSRIPKNLVLLARAWTLLFWLLTLPLISLVLKSLKRYGQKVQPQSDEVSTEHKNNRNTVIFSVHLQCQSCRHPGLSRGFVDYS